MPRKGQCPRGADTSAQPVPTGPPAPRPGCRPHAGLSPQSSDRLPEGRRQYPGAPVTGWEHLPHLLRGGPVPEAGAVQEGADALGEERGTPPPVPAPPSLWRFRGGGWRCCRVKFSPWSRAGAAGSEPRDSPRLGQGVRWSQEDSGSEAAAGIGTFLTLDFFFFLPVLCWSPDTLPETGCTAVVQQVSALSQLWAPCGFRSSKPP